MKKIITIVALLATMISYAGPKEDLKKAEKLLQEGKTEEVIKILESTEAKKGEEKEFEKINFALVNYYQNLDEKKAIKYAKLISDNTNSTSIEAKTVDLALYQFSKENKEKIKYLERLIARYSSKEYGSGEFLERLAILNSEYELQGLNSKKSSLYNKLQKAGIDPTALDLYTSTTLIQVDYKKASPYLEKAIKSTNSGVKTQALLLKARYLVANKKEKEGYKLLEEIEKLNPKSATVLFEISSFYAKNDLNKQKSYLEKAYKLDKNQMVYILNLIDVSNKLNDKKAFSQWVAISKNKDKNINDVSLADIFLKNGDLKLAKKFALDGYNKKEKDAAYLLMSIALNEYDKENVKKYAKEVIENNKDKNVLEALKEVIKDVDLNIALAAFNNEDFDISEKFANKAKDKNKASEILNAIKQIKGARK